MFKGEMENESVSILASIKGEPLVLVNFPVKTMLSRATFPCSVILDIVCLPMASVIVTLDPLKPTHTFVQSSVSVPTDTTIRAIAMKFGTHSETSADQYATKSSL